MKIQIITPILLGKEEYERVKSLYQGYASAGTILRVDFLDRGPASIESEYEGALAVPEILRLCKQGEEDGVDAIIINCMSDPGLTAARELVGIPVVGPAQASMYLAAALAENFSVITLLEKNDPPRFRDLFRRYGFMDRGCSVRTIGIPVLSLHNDRASLLRSLVEETVLAIVEDGAHAIILGCGSLGGQLALDTQSGLEEAGYVGVPVIDPVGAPMMMAEALVRLGISHSKLTFPSPPEKRILGYEGQ